FDSMSFRKGIEFELSNALVQRISVNTPYKIRANKRDADSVIYGKIIGVNERVQAHQRQLDRPMQEKIVVTAEVTWKDLRTGELLIDRQRYRFSGMYASLRNDSVKVATQEAVNKIANEIVESMEQGW
ncbi:MAG: LPS assembly lipoprotein LptE, partial [Proteobacteria bacterium]|nr:LPS assembly lipoprotein LptE [Pseudomonadota bacterium]